MSTATDTDVDFDVDEVEDTEVEATEKPKKEKKEKAPARPPLPEGFVTPIGLTKAINEQGLYDGKTDELRPQAMYSYIKNAPADHPFPMVERNGRNCVDLEEGLAWWKEKNERAAKRRANASEKKNAKAQRAEAKAEESEAEGDDTPDLDEAE